MPPTVAILGCGLIGGSIALAIKRKWKRAIVTGCDRPKVLKTAKQRKAIRHTITRRELFKRLDSFDILILATNVDQILLDIQHLPLQGGPLTIDVGSVKGPILAAAHKTQRFIGGHPMAGSEASGIDYASASLLDGRPFVLCPAAQTRNSDLTRAKQFVRDLGAVPRILDAATHDRCVALVSHLPHLLSRCLMNQGRELADDIRTARLPWSLAAGSWRDATRVAASDPKLWDAIFQSNRDALLHATDDLIAQLQTARAALAERSRPVPNAAALARLRTRIRRFLPPSS